MKTFLRVIGFYKLYKKWASAMVFLAFLQGVFALVEPIFYREIINTLVNSIENKVLGSLVWKILILWISLAVVVIFTQALLSYFSDVLVHKIYVKIWNRISEKVLTLSLKFHADRKAGTTMRNIDRGADNIFSLQLNFLRKSLPHIFSLIFLFPLLIYLHWKMAIIILGLVPFLSLVAAWGNVRTRKKQAEADAGWLRASGLLLDSLVNIAIIKSFTALGYKLTQVKKTVLGAHKKQLPVLKWWTFLIIITRFSAVFANLLIFGIGTWFYLKNQITIGEIVMFLSYAIMILSYIEEIFWTFNDFLWRRYKIEQFFEIWDEEPAVRDLPQAKEMPPVKGEVEFRKVNFSHEGKIEAIREVSFHAKPGETIALVGHTGSGKSTIVNLLSRFFDVKNGEILIDGININEVKQDSLRANIGMVFQENLLFHASILENLKIGKPNATKEEIEKACRAAHTLEFIARAPKGFQTIVGERGIKLSGGEKQRIAIARALLKDPPILVLDEATSALDAETEQKIQAALAKLIRGRTTFIVAHRLSTIRNADKIIVLDRGRIKESGTYATLMHKKGYFYRLIKAQVSGFVV